MKRAILFAVIILAMVITPLAVYANDVQIDSNGNVKTGVSNPGGYGNLDVTGASGEHAVRGVTSGTGAAGVYGKNNDTSGYGGYFEGNARVTGNLTVDGTISSPSLNADTLDGSHASAFAPSSHTSRTDNPHSVTAAQTGAATIAHNHDTVYYTRTEVDTMLASRDAAVAALQTQVTALEALLTHFSRSGNDLYLTGANLHIVNGTGATNGTVNGLGNLIIGYNELRGTSDDRSGSHNIILGRKNNYSSYGGLVAGEWSVISGAFATVTGGSNNTASGDFSSIGSGMWNTASNDHASVSGGFYNEATNIGSSVGGGSGNTASGVYAGITGGSDNTASGDFSSISGGYQNTADGYYSTISGGINNSAVGDYSFIGGGGNPDPAYGNKTYANYSAILGGEANKTGDITRMNIGEYSTVSGGNANSATARSSSVSGGRSNTASGWYSTVSGGNGLSATATDQWKAPGH